MDAYLVYGNYLCSLLKALIKGEETPKPDFEIDWELFYNLSKHHKVGNMVYIATKGFDIPENVRTLFADDFYKSSVREAKQELFSASVYKKFEQADVSFLPVKGILIKKLYPVENYRSSNDIDILIKSGDFEKAQAVMESSGFKSEGLGNEDNDYHIEYHKNIVSIELHSSLTPRDSVQYDYFISAFDRAKTTENSNNHYIMTDEDFYIYVLYHLYKHFIKGGVGIRYFLDIYLINQKMTFNQDYLKKELSKIGLWEFNQTVKELSEVFYNDKGADSRLTELSRFVFISGAHGDSTFYAMSKFSGEGTKKNNYLLNKIKYFIKAWFIGRRAMSERYPSLKKHGWLLPFCYIHKGFYTIFCKPKAIKEQVNEVKNLNKDVAGYVENINHLAGL